MSTRMIVATVLVAAGTLAGCTSAEDRACQGFAGLADSTDHFSRDMSYADYAKVRDQLLGVDAELNESGTRFLETLRKIEFIPDDDLGAAMALAPAMAMATIDVTAACAEHGVTVDLTSR